jgi:hypothetical protein
MADQKYYRIAALDVVAQRFEQGRVAQAEVFLVADVEAFAAQLPGQSLPMNV